MKTGSAAWRQLIIDGCALLGVDVLAEHVVQFAAHAEEMEVWNRKVNLTAIADPKEVAVKHYIDTLAAAPWIPPDALLLDIGSGAGFPGIPLKVVMPSLTVLLVDSSRKKVSFQRHVIRLLGLKQIQARHLRVEEMGHDSDFRQQFDVVISRAFTDLESMVSVSQPLLKGGGAIIALKGRAETENEIESTSEMLDNRLFSGLMPPEVTRYTLPYIPSERSIISIKKEPVNPIG